MNNTIPESLSHLSVAKYRGAKAPHKAVLLLAVIDLIEAKSITTPFIYINDELIAKFDDVWNYYVGDASNFKPDLCKPFYHLQDEPFWRLIGRNKQDDDIPQDAVRYSIEYLRGTYECAMLDRSLFDYLQDEANRGEVRSILIGNYLTIRPDSSIQLA